MLKEQTQLERRRLAALNEQGAIYGGMTANAIGPVNPAHINSNGANFGVYPNTVPNQGYYTKGYTNASTHEDRLRKLEEAATLALNKSSQFMADIQNLEIEVQQKQEQIDKLSTDTISNRVEIDRLKSAAKEKQVRVENYAEQNRLLLEDIDSKDDEIQRLSRELAALKKEQNDE